MYQKIIKNLRDQLDTANNKIETFKFELEKNSTDEMVKITSDMFKLVPDKQLETSIENVEKDDPEQEQINNSSNAYIKPDPQILKEFQEELPNLDILEQELVCIPVGWWLEQKELEYIIQKIIYIL